MAVGCANCLSLFRRSSLPHHLTLGQPTSRGEPGGVNATASRVRQKSSPMPNVYALASIGSGASLSQACFQCLSTFGRSLHTPSMHDGAILQFIVAPPQPGFLCTSYTGCSLHDDPHQLKAVPT